LQTGAKPERAATVRIFRNAGKARCFFGGIIELSEYCELFKVGQEKNPEKTKKGSRPSISQWMRRHFTISRLETMQSDAIQGGNQTLRLLRRQFFPAPSVPGTGMSPPHMEGGSESVA
jgi:hypothetical protein